MGLEAGIFQLLTATATLTALQQARVTAVMLPPRPVFPATTFQIVGGSAQPTFDTPGMQRRRVQFDFWADYEQGTYDEAVALRDATIKLLGQFQGKLPNGMYVTVSYIQSIDHFDSDARRYRCTAEFYFYFNL